MENFGFKASFDFEYGGSSQSSLKNALSDLNQLADSLKRTSKLSADLNKGISQSFRRKGKGAANNIKQFADPSKQLKEHLRSIRAEFRALDKESKLIKTGGLGDTRAFERGERDVLKYVESLDKLQREIKGNTAAERDLLATLKRKQNLATDRLSQLKQERDLYQEQQKLLRETTKLAQARTINEVSKAGLSGVSSFLKRGVDIYGEFDQTITEVIAKTRADLEQKQQLIDTTLRLGSSTRYSATQAAQGATFLAQAGFTVNETLQALPATLDLAITGNLELARSADIVSNVLSSFQIKPFMDGIDQTAKAADILSYVANTMNTNVEQMGEAFAYAGQPAKTFGLDIAQTAALIGVAGNVGIQASSAGTGMRQGLIELANQNKQELLKGVGRDRGKDINFTNEKGELLDIVEILKQINDVTATMGDADKLSLLTKIFGKTGVGFWQAQLNDLELLSKKISELQHNAVGYSTATSKEMSKGLLPALTALNSAVETFYIKIISKISPVLTSVVNGITAAVRAVNALPESLISLIGYGSLAAAGILAIGVAASGVGLALFGLRQSTSLITTSMTSLGIQGTLAAPGVGLLTDQLNKVPVAMSGISAGGGTAIPLMRLLGVTLGAALFNPITLTVTALTGLYFLLEKIAPQVNVVKTSIMSLAKVGGYVGGFLSGLFGQTFKNIATALQGAGVVFNPLSTAIKTVEAAVNSFIGTYKQAFTSGQSIGVVVANAIAKQWLLTFSVIAGGLQRFVGFLSTLIHPITAALSEGSPGPTYYIRQNWQKTLLFIIEAVKKSVGVISKNFALLTKTASINYLLTTFKSLIKPAKLIRDELLAISGIVASELPPGFTKTLRLVIQIGALIFPVFGTLNKIISLLRQNESHILLANNLDDIKKAVIGVTGVVFLLGSAIAGGPLIFIKKFLGLAVLSSGILSKVFNYLNRTGKLGKAFNVILIAVNALKLLNIDKTISQIESGFKVIKSSFKEISPELNTLLHVLATITDIFVIKLPKGLLKIVKSIDGIFKSIAPITGAVTKFFSLPFGENFSDKFSSLISAVTRNVVSLTGVFFLIGSAIAGGPIKFMSQFVQTIFKARDAITGLFNKAGRFKDLNLGGDPNERKAVNEVRAELLRQQKEMRSQIVKDYRFGGALFREQNKDLVERGMFGQLKVSQKGQAEIQRRTISGGQVFQSSRLQQRLQQQGLDLGGLDKNRILGIASNTQNRYTALASELTQAIKLQSIKEAVIASAIFKNVKLPSVLSEATSKANKPSKAIVPPIKNFTYPELQDKILRLQQDGAIERSFRRNQKHEILLDRYRQATEQGYRSPLQRMLPPPVQIDSRSNKASISLQQQSQKSTTKIQQYWLKTTSKINTLLRGMQQTAKKVGNKIQRNIAEGSPGPSYYVRVYWAKTATAVKQQLKGIAATAQKVGRNTRGIMTKGLAIGGAVAGFSFALQQGSGALHNLGIVSDKQYEKLSKIFEVFTLIGAGGMALSAIFSGVSAVAGLAGSAIALAFSPVGLTIAAVVGGVWLLNKAIKSLFNIDIAGGFVGKLTGGFKVLAVGAKNLAGKLIGSLNHNPTEVIPEAWSGAVEDIKDKQFGDWLDSAKNVGGELNENLSLIPSIWEKGVRRVKDWYFKELESQADVTGEKINNSLSTIKAVSITPVEIVSQKKQAYNALEDIKTSLNQAIQPAKDFYQTIEDGVVHLQRGATVTELMRSPMQELASAAKNFGSSFAIFGSDIWEGITTFNPGKVFGAFTRFGENMGFIISQVDSSIKAMGVSMVAVGISSVLSLSPILLISGGIAIAALAIMKNFLGVRTLLKGLGKVAIGVGLSVIYIVQFISKTLQGVSKIIQGLVIFDIHKVKEGIRGIKEAWGDFGSKVKSSLGTLFDGLADVFVNTFIDAYNQVFRISKENIDKLRVNLLPVLKDIGTEISAGMGSYLSTVKANAPEFIAEIKVLGAAVGESLVKAIRFTVEKLPGIIRSSFQQLWSNIKTDSTDGMAQLKAVTSIQGLFPSSAVRDRVKLFWQAINEESDGRLSQVFSTQVLKQQLSRLPNIVTEPIIQSWSAIKAVSQRQFEGLSQDLQQSLREFVGHFKTGIKSVANFIKGEIGSAELFEGLKENARITLSTVQQIVSQFSLSEVRGIVARAVLDIESGLNNLPSLVKVPLEKVAAVIQSGVGGVFDLLAPELKSGAARLKASISDSLDSVFEFLKDPDYDGGELFNRLRRNSIEAFEAIKAIASQFNLEAIRSHVSEITLGIESKVKNLIDLLKGKFEELPRIVKTPLTVTGDLVRGGVKNMFDSLSTDLKTSLSQLKQLVSDSTANIFDFLKNPEYSGKELFAHLKDNAVAAFDSVKVAVREFYTLFSETFGAIKSKTDETFSYLGRRATEDIEKVKSAFNSVRNIFSRNTDAIEANADKTQKGILGMFRRVESEAKPTGKEIQASLSEASPGPTYQIRMAWKRTGEFIVATMKDVAQSANHFGKKIQTGFLDRAVPRTKVKKKGKLGLDDANQITSTIGGFASNFGGGLAMPLFFLGDLIDVVQLFGTMSAKGLTLTGVFAGLKAGIAGFAAAAIPAIGAFLTAAAPVVAVVAAIAGVGVLLHRAYQDNFTGIRDTINAVKAGFDAFWDVLNSGAAQAGLSILQTIETEFRSLINLVGQSINYLWEPFGDLLREIANLFGADIKTGTEGLKQILVAIGEVVGKRIVTGIQVLAFGITTVIRGISLVLQGLIMVGTAVTKVVLLPFELVARTITAIIQGFKTLIGAASTALKPMVQLLNFGGALKGGINLAQRFFQKSNPQNNIQAFSSGGWVRGQGTSVSDSIPTLLSNGEFVINAAQATHHAPIVEAINQGNFSVPQVLETTAQSFPAPLNYTPPQPTQTTTTTPQNININLSFGDVVVQGATGTEAANDFLQKINPQLRRAVLQILREAAETRI